MKTVLAGLALSATLMTGAAEAATVSFLGSSPFGEDFTIGRFDTGLGTLTGVVIDLFAEAYNPVTESAFDGDTVTVISQASIKVTFAGLEFSDSDSKTEACSAPESELCVASASARAEIKFIGDVFPDFALVSGGGPGTLPVQVTFFDTGAVVNLSVTYTYDEAVAPVPLPAAGGLVLAGLGGLALLRRRADPAPKTGRS
jgi:hypothetical protein